MAILCATIIFSSNLNVIRATFTAVLPVLSNAGTLATKRRVPVSAGTLPTDGTLFVVLLMGTIVIVGCLTFFPALGLGPAAEHVAMQAGVTY
jgi:K+-transporting ATPase ATPase A chain